MGEYKGFALEPNWPGLHPGGDRVDVNRQALRSLADSLEEELGRLIEGSGSHADLADRGRLTAAQVGGWDVATILYGALGSTYAEITGKYQALAEKVTMVIALMRAAADNVQHGEDATSG